MALSVLVAYLLGSIPFGLLLTRAAGMGDIRAIGSGNIGATNVMRTGNKKLGILTLLLDMGKGSLAMALAPLLVVSPDLTSYALAFYAVALGHIFPIWLRFKGGKGVATVFGALWALHWPFGLIFMAAWLLIFAACRYVSLASMGAMGAVMLSPIFLYEDMMAVHGFYLFLPAFLLIVYTHRSNIRRLRRGEESRLGKKKA